jgi:hypothetical protein
MAFRIEKVNNIRNIRPEGNYLKLENQEWMIEDITISASGKVCLKLWDPAHKQRSVKQICTIEELVLTIPEAEFIQY